MTALAGQGIQVETHTFTHRISTLGDDDIIDLTDYCQEALGASRISNGVLICFVSHSTCAITTMEFEPGAVADLKAWLQIAIPAGTEYRHNILNHDTNAHAHLRCAILGPSIAVPIADSTLLLGTWQTPVLIDSDDRPRTRDVTFQVIGT